MGWEQVLAGLAGCTMALALHLDASVEDFAGCLLSH